MSHVYHVSPLEIGGMTLGQVNAYMRNVEMFMGDGKKASGVGRPGPRRSQEELAMLARARGVRPPIVKKPQMGTDKHGSQKG